MLNVGKSLLKVNVNVPMFNKQNNNKQKFLWLKDFPERCRVRFSVKN